ncbi:MAG: TolC family protein [Gemmatimonadota bacterium]
MTVRAISIGAFCFGLTVLAASPAMAQTIDRRPLTLEQAVQEALEGNLQLRIERARMESARAAGRSATSSLLPRIDLQSGWTRSDDPVAVFGTKLRQGSFTQSDFDLNTLNRPDPLTDWSTAVSASWTLLNPTGWAGSSEAGSRAEAATWSLQRSREAARLATETLYLDIVRAEARVHAATQTEIAAQATADLFARREAQGLLTRAESLQAESDRAGATALRIDAERLNVDAAERLTLFLGWPPNRLPLPLDTLLSPSDFAPRATAEPQQSSEAVPMIRRADIRARQAELEASRASHRRANAAWFPAIVASGRYGIHSTDAFGSSGENWSVAVAVRWNLFSGGGRLAESARTRADLRIAETLYEQALNEALVELKSAGRAVDAAAQMAEAAIAARIAAESGTSLMRRRFEEGLTTASDLLSAESRLARTAQTEVDALASHQLAIARLRFVTTHEHPEDSL